MRSPSRRTQKVLVAATTPVAVVCAAAMVYQASYAAFSGQTRNSGNDWSTGSVTLSDDDNGSARFQVSNMVPGSTDTKCLTVTANASVASTVKAYTVNPVPSTSGLEERVFISIRHGSGGSYASCSGFQSAGTVLPPTSLAVLANANDFSKGVGGWSVPAGTTSKTYEITWSFDTTGLTQAQVDRFQGTRTGIDVQWEMQTTDS